MRGRYRHRHRAPGPSWLGLGLLVLALLVAEALFLLTVVGGQPDGAALGGTTGTGVVSPTAVRPGG